MFEASKKTKFSQTALADCVQEEEEEKQQRNVTKLTLLTGFCSEKKTQKEKLQVDLPMSKVLSSAVYGEVDEKLWGIAVFIAKGNLSLNPHC